MPELKNLRERAFQHYSSGCDDIFIAYVHWYCHSFFPLCMDGCHDAGTCLVYDLTVTPNPRLASRFALPGHVPGTPKSLLRVVRKLIKKLYSGGVAFPALTRSLVYLRCRSCSLSPPSLSLPLSPSPPLSLSLSLSQFCLFTWATTASLSLAAPTALFVSSLRAPLLGRVNV